MLRSPKPGSPKSLVQSIVDHFQTLVDEGKLHPGMKLPSIRRFADSRGVSVSTVVDAYDRLVATGLIAARQNAGFYVRGFPYGQHPDGHAGDHRADGLDPFWLIRHIGYAHDVEINPGCGWLPSRWMDEDVLRRAMRGVAAQANAPMTNYGTPKGYLPLRWKISDSLNRQEVFCPPGQIMTTAGATHALSLLVQHLVKPGDTVLVDQPGYSPVFSSLKRVGARMLGVPWTPSGPDIVALDQILGEHAPGVYFTNPRLHNPTGASCSPATAYRLLQLAARHDFLIVEDDVCAGLDDPSRRPLASMDQLERVIHVGSFSKTVSPGLRVGHVAAHPDLIEALTRFKMITGLTTSEIGERCVYQVLTGGRYRKHLKGLRENLLRAREETRRKLVAAGLAVFDPSGDGLFVWAHHPGYADSRALSAQALERQIYLAPGHLFMPDEALTPWIRFNVGHCENDALFDFLANVRPANAQPVPGAA